MMRYLNKSINLYLTYNKIINFICYADAAYVDNRIDLKLTYDHTLLIKNETITCINKKQKTVVSFTIETKYIIMCQINKNIV